MNYARIEDGKVVEIILPAADGEGVSIPIEDRFHPDFVATLVECPEDTLPGYSYDGQSFHAPAPPPGPTMEERAKVLLAGVDAHLNAAARAKGYDSIITAALRAALPASPFHSEGLAFGTWMDAVYAKCYEVLAQVQANEIAEPDEAQLIAMLPALQLPS